MSQQKAKYWWAVCYPENMIPDWQEKIDDLLQLPYAYCIHNKDLDGNDEDRKEHVHIMIAFPNTTTHNHALSVFKELNAPGRSCVNECKRIISVRQAYNYLIHDTDKCREKNKHLYDKSERITGNNFDIGSYEQIGLEEKAKIRRTLSAFLLHKGFTTYALFYDYVRKNFDDPEYENIVVTYQGHFDKLCKGCYHQKERKKELVMKEAEKEDKKADIAERENNERDS